MFRHRLILTGICVLLAGAACGKKKSTSQAGSTAQNANNSNNTPTLIDGSLGTISFDPHPSDCGSGNISAVTTVSACPTTIGTGQTNEGMCFVDSSVQPTWVNEPPSSGPEYDSPDFTWYESATPIPRGTWVRNLAHGFVVMLYNCPSGCTPELTTMRQVLTDYAGTPVILTPDPLLHTGTRFSIVSWTWAFNYDEPDLPTLECFIQQHVNQALFVTH